MTEIQRCALPHALGGRDILGASRTGSGKTLSYLIPLIERLYLNCWTPYDGVGGLIILPTRELVKKTLILKKKTYFIRQSKFSRSLSRLLIITCSQLDC